MAKLPLPYGRGSELHHGSPDTDPRDKASRAHDICVPEEVSIIQPFDLFLNSLTFDD